MNERQRIERPRQTNSVATAAGTRSNPFRRPGRRNPRSTVRVHFLWLDIGLSPAANLSNSRSGSARQAGSLRRRSPDLLARDRASFCSRHLHRRGFLHSKFGFTTLASTSSFERINLRDDRVSRNEVCRSTAFSYRWQRRPASPANPAHGSNWSRCFGRTADRSSYAACGGETRKLRWAALLKVELTFKKISNVE